MYWIDGCGLYSFPVLTHWGRVTHICVGNLTIIGPDNGLSPGRRQAIIWTNAGILLIGPWGTNFSEISIGIHTSIFIQENSFENGVCEMASILSRPQCVKMQPKIFIWWFVFLENIFRICEKFYGENSWCHRGVFRNKKHILFLYIKESVFYQLFHCQKCLGLDDMTFDT